MFDGHLPSRIYSDGLCQSRKNGRTAQGVLKCRQQVNPLFSESGEVAANTTEHDGPLLTTKATRDFLLYLDHA